jgi:hypothetical protein
VTLIAEAGNESNLGEGAPCSDESSSQSESPLHDVGVRRKAKFASEPTKQLVATEPNLLGKLDEG